MNITRRTDYAIRLITALIEAQGKPLSVRLVAQDYHVPYSFARSIQHDLVNAGLIKSLRGAQGGMVLAQDPGKISLLTIIEAVQGPIGLGVCSREEGWCPREKRCQFHPVWQGLDQMIRDYLCSVSMKDVVEGTRYPNLPQEYWSAEAFMPQNIRMRRANRLRNDPCAGACDC